MLQKIKGFHLFPSDDRNKKQVLFCLTLITFLASLPQLCGYIGSGEKLARYLQHIEMIKEGITNGQFYILMEPMQEAGYADTVFCCNILFFVQALLRVLGVSVTAGYSIYCIMLNVLTTWIAWYCFGKIFQSNSVGLVCSALYTLSIPRIYRLVVAGAVEEVSALMFLPFIVYGLYCVLLEEQEKKRNGAPWVSLVVGYTGLIQTHLLTYEITLCITVLICLLCVRKLFCRSAFPQLLKGICAAAGLSMWYCIPLVDSYLRNDRLSHDAIQGNGLFITQVLYQFWGLASKGVKGDSGMMAANPDGVGFVLFFGLVVFAAMWFQGYFLSQEEGCFRLAKISCVFGFVLLCMTLRNFPWDRIQRLNCLSSVLVGELKSPDRLLGWALTFLVTVFGFCLWYFRNREGYFYWIGIGLAIFTVIFGSMSLMESLITGESSGIVYDLEAWRTVDGAEASFCIFDGPWYWVTGEIITVGTVLGIGIRWWRKRRKKA